ncbi:MAG: diphthine synthase [Thermoplasmata archaeon HGW-Thermoplasmata-1]|nr:MAG: diphthine synthase [Thermoplasmata archaeon HGW-Thermoplasmata-1]
MGELIFVGLGLYDERDITLKGLDEIRSSDRVFAEFYTAHLSGSSIGRLEELFGKKITALDRAGVEQMEEELLAAAENGKVAFITAGDSMTATTHVDLRMRAHERGIITKVVHGVSIATAAAGLLGLQSYKFGRATTLVFPEKNYFPISPYDVIRSNLAQGLHTLVLLDIRADEGRYMTASEGAKIIMRMAEETGDGGVDGKTVACGIARAGSGSPMIVAGPLSEIAKTDFGPPLHCLVIPGKMHFMEEGALRVLCGMR